MAQGVVGGRGTLQSAVDAAVFETSVAPRYLAWFVEPAIERLAVGRDARLLHLDCRTGSFDERVVAKLPNADFFGCDASEAALSLARAKGRAAGHASVHFRHVAGGALPFPPGAFSHALVTHPVSEPAGWPSLFRDLANLVAPRGQVVVSAPLRDSFVELADLFREAALRSDAPEWIERIDRGALGRPTDEILARLLEAAGFEHVEVACFTHTFPFPSGREWLDDPVTRLAIVPDLLAAELAEVPDADARLRYAREAIDRYWSDGGFELTVKVGVATGRRPA